MEIKLLEPGYKTDDGFYQAFLDNKLMNSEFISENTVHIPYELSEFPIYFHIKNADERERQYVPMIKTMANEVICLERDIYMDELFWHSWLCLYRREYLLKTYPEIKDSYEKFANIVIKPFDWENYIYKAILIAQYVTDWTPEVEKDKYYHLILQNMDMFNYIIKYEIFRNGKFLIDIMRLTDELQLGAVLKAKIKGRSDLGADERYGRRVIYEFNKSYPIVLGPMLEYEELKRYFLKFLGYYYDGSAVNDSGDDEGEY